MERLREPALLALFRRDRAVALGGLVLITVLAWLYTLRAVGHPAGGGAGERLGFLAAMWSVMMIAMMAPVAAPPILTFVRLSRRRRTERDPVFHAGALAAGFLAVWVAYSVAAALAQWGLESLGWRPEASPGSLSGGALLILAGLYQLSPLKHACLSRCRSPLGMLMAGHRPGAAGAMRMGAEHGAHCVACCWALMALMLLAGAMSPLWLAALAAYCLGERLLPAGHLVGHIAGIALLGWGLYVIVG